MITDDFLLFANAQASVRAAGNYISTNVLDLGSARDIGSGEPLQIYINVDIAFAGGTSVEFQVVTADDAAISTNVTVIGSTGAILLAALIAGFSTYLDVPPARGNVRRRYMAIRAVGVGTFTLGSFSARIVKDAQDAPNYASGFTIQ